MKTNTRITWLFTIIALASLTITFAQDTGHMMMDDHMMSGSMMSWDKMMKADDKMMMDDKMTMKKDDMMMKDLKKLTVAILAKKMGYTWKTDRSSLAKKAGITNYKGTKAQNIKIKTYLLSMAK